MTVLSNNLFNTPYPRSCLSGVESFCLQWFWVPFRALAFPLNRVWAGSPMEPQFLSPGGIIVRAVPIEKV